MCGFRMITTGRNFTRYGLLIIGLIWPVFAGSFELQHRELAQMPSAASFYAVEGSVLVEAAFNRRGEVSARSVSVVESNPPGFFEAAAKHAVRRYRASGCDSPPCKFRQSVRFRLADGQFGIERPVPPPRPLYPDCHAVVVDESEAGQMVGELLSQPVGARVRSLYAWGDDALASRVVTEAAQAQAQDRPVIARATQIIWGSSFAVDDSVIDNSWLATTRNWHIVGLWSTRNCAMEQQLVTVHLQVPDGGTTDDGSVLWRNAVLSLLFEQHDGALALVFAQDIVDIALHPLVYSDSIAFALENGRRDYADGVYKALRRQFDFDRAASALLVGFEEDDANAVLQAFDALPAWMRTRYSVQRRAETAALIAAADDYWRKYPDWTSGWAEMEMRTLGNVLQNWIDQGDIDSINTVVSQLRQRLNVRVHNQRIMVVRKRGAPQAGAD